MIPNKSKLTAKIAAMSYEERKAYYTTLPDKPPLTDLQRLAQKENFALFTLKGIKAQLPHLTNVPGIGTINCEKIRLYAVQMEKNIKYQQDLRKNKKAMDKANKSKSKGSK